MFKSTVISVLALCSARAATSSDVLLRAMHDELAHARTLETLNLEKPYFISYDLEDVSTFSATASLGGLIRENTAQYRFPRVQVRVGDYQFDNTNYTGSGLNLGSRYDIERFPVDDQYPVVRRYLWLATDQAYKAAVEAIARKRAALKNMSAAEQLSDFARAEPTRQMDDVPAGTLERQTWLARVRALSAIYADFPGVLSSEVEFHALHNIRRLVTSEGTEVRTAEDAIIVLTRAVGQAPDGMRLRDSAVIQAAGFGQVPDEAELANQVRRVAENVAALAAAPAGETYNGPVLFEGVAAAQLFAQLLGQNLALTRRPLTEPGRPSVFPVSELEGRQQARILPEWMDAVDDPTKKQGQSRRLFGSYSVDFEGVRPEPLAIVEKGVLKNFLLTRQPVAGFTASNGRARLPGAFGASTAAISNLFVRAEQTVPLPELKKRLIEICQARNQKYGIIVTKLDFPSSASTEELRRLMATRVREGDGSHPVSLPILIYKVFPDGKEELIRGVRFRDLNVRALKDIRFAANDSNVFDYLENGAPLAAMGQAAYVAECSVIAPSVLVDDVEVRKLDEELPKLPVVPPPLAAGQ